MRRKFIHASSIIAYPCVFGQEIQLDHIREQMLHVDNHSRFRLTATHRMRTRMQIGGRAMHSTYRREINLTVSLSFQTSRSEKYSIRPIARANCNETHSIQFLEVLEFKYPKVWALHSDRLQVLKSTIRGDYRVKRNYTSKCKMTRISPRRDKIISRRFLYMS